MGSILEVGLAPRDSGMLLLIAMIPFAPVGV
jgi:hypothetical protein